MIERLTKTNHDNLIRVNLNKQSYLLLTWAEYVSGLARAKAERRTENLRRRAHSVEQDGEDCPRLMERPKT
jgi:hypothetical protein